MGALLYPLLALFRYPTIYPLSLSVYLLGFWYLVRAKKNADRKIGAINRYYMGI